MAPNLTSWDEGNVHPFWTIIIIHQLCLSDLLNINLKFIYCNFSQIQPVLRSRKYVFLQIKAAQARSNCGLGVCLMGPEGVKKGKKTTWRCSQGRTRPCFWTKAWLPQSEVWGRKPRGVRGNVTNNNAAVRRRDRAQSRRSGSARRVQWRRKEIISLKNVTEL